MVRASTLLIPVGIVGLLFGIVPLPMTGLVFAVLLIAAGIVCRALGY